MGTLKVIIFLKECQEQNLVLLKKYFKIKSIDQYFNDLSNNEKKNNLSELEIKGILNKKKFFTKRNLKNETESITNYSIIDIDDEELEIKEYKTTPLIPSFNYDLREANEINESSDKNNNEQK